MCADPGARTPIGASGITNIITYMGIRVGNIAQIGIFKFYIAGTRTISLWWKDMEMNLKSASLYCSA